MPTNPERSVPEADGSSLICKICGAEGSAHKPGCPFRTGEVEAIAPLPSQLPEAQEAPANADVLSAVQMVEQAKQERERLLAEEEKLRTELGQETTDRLTRWS
ncbi:MAG: hypothetical protein Q8P82_01640, partial [bacterium]|nr:hypothetical protein [bacterium]